jgi:hypothetical protein
MSRWPISDEEREQILKLKRKLRKRDPLHGVVDTLLGGGALPYADAELVVKTLESDQGRRPVRAIAAWAAGLADLDEEQGRRADIALVSLLGNRPSNEFACCMAAGCCFGGWPVLLFMPFIPFLLASDRAINRLRALAAVSLGRLGHAYNIGALLDAVLPGKGRSSGGEKEARFAAVYGLSLILNRLGGKTDSLIDEASERALCMLLAEASPGSVWSITEVLKAVGTPRSIRSLKRYLKRLEMSQSMEHDAVKSTVELLEAREEFNKQRASLLRPAETPAQPDFLLRSWESQGTEDQSLLLRPTEGEEDS